MKDNDKIIIVVLNLDLMFKKNICFPLYYISLSLTFLLNWKKLFLKHIPNSDIEIHEPNIFFLS